MTAYESQGKSEEKKQRLIERREKLASLLAEERDMYEVSLRRLLLVNWSVTLSPAQREFKDSSSSKLNHMKHK